MIIILDLNWIFGATYPTSPALPQGDSNTAVNPANWNTLVDNINAIGADLVDARSDDDDWPTGSEHQSGQASDWDKMADIIRHMIKELSGEDHYYDDPAGSLKVHTHAAGQGGIIPWSSIGSPTARTLVLAVEYPGNVLTFSKHGGAASGNNDGTHSSAQEVVSNIGYNYYEFTSPETSLQDEYIAILITLPEDFNDWATANAIEIEYKTESGASVNCKVNAYAYQRGSATVAGGSENNTSTVWSTLSIDDSALKASHSWSAGDVLELYVELATRNNYFARCGKITLNYTS